MSVTHVAAQSIDIDGRVIQRCLVCGEKLIDTLKGGGVKEKTGVIGIVSKGPFVGGGPVSPGGVVTFPPNSQVRVNDEGVAVLLQNEVDPDGRGQVFTKDFCVDLVE